eukprot:TRINITY_DN3619_c0_g1_i7.p1 TRINITY_DN3619_c0_g1~~TRINITY_DN3619_c0_g1_i7.p1  ORF type:complete len:118 (+),score=24.74 TRINITY_DN3619_c0_g1_i7:94-447(+)
MIRRPPRSTQGVSSAASDVYKRQGADSGVKEPYEAVRDYDVSTKVIDGYQSRYCDTWGDTMSYEGAEKCARIHNGGPKGYMKSATDSYAEKFMHNLCLLYTSPSPRDLSTSRMPSSA